MRSKAPVPISSVCTIVGSEFVYTSKRERADHKSRAQPSCSGIRNDLRCCARSARSAASTSLLLGRSRVLHSASPRLLSYWRPDSHVNAFECASAAAGLLSGALVGAVRILADRHAYRDGAGSVLCVTAGLFT